MVLASADRGYQANFISLVQDGIWLGVVGVDRYDDFRLERGQPGKLAPDFRGQIVHRSSLRKLQRKLAASGALSIQCKKSNV
jgi:hypothetical protein